jgi:phosphoglycolate phosphatase-like HAD superfamily hydrolase
MLQAVIWDYDGTLAPTNERQFNWFEYWWNHSENAGRVKGKEFPYADLGTFMEMYNSQCHREGGVQNVYNLLGLSCDMGDKEHPVWAAYKNFLSEHPSKLYPGIKKTLKEIWEVGSLNKYAKRNKRLRLGINTTNVWASIYKDLVNNGVAQFFDSFISEEVLREYIGIGNPDSIKKPSKISLALALGLIDSEGEHTMHIGDTLNDLAASQKIIRLNPLHPETLITVGVSWGYEGRKNLEKGVEVLREGTVHFNHIVDKPSEIVELVKKYLE